MESYEVIYKDEDDDTGCDGCCFDRGKKCALMDDIRLSICLIDEDGDCGEGTEFIYKQTN